jgi:plasmid maintenance system antidote protein VapI
MTPALLRAAGELLYGPRWQAELAREIGRARSLVAAMAAGERAVTPETWALVLDLLKSRHVDIAAFLKSNRG